MTQRLYQGIEGIADASLVLQTVKGTGFSCATERPVNIAALAAEGMQISGSKFPQGLKPQILISHQAARLKPRPFKDFDKLHEECGIVAIHGHPDAARQAYLALYALQHRGQ